MKITAYHGSPFNFNCFDNDYLGINGGEGTTRGFFFAEDKDHAEYWCDRNSDETAAEGQDIFPTIFTVEINAENIFEADIMEYKYLDQLIDDAAKAGADVAIINNVLDDESDYRRTMYFVFDSGNISIIEKDAR